MGITTTTTKPGVSEEPVTTVDRDATNLTNVATTTLETTTQTTQRVATVAAEGTRSKTALPLEAPSIMQSMANVDDRQRTFAFLMRAPVNHAPSCMPDDRCIVDTACTAHMTSERDHLPDVKGIPNRSKWSVAVAPC